MAGGDGAGARRTGRRRADPRHPPASATVSRSPPRWSRRTSPRRRRRAPTRRRVAALDFHGVPRGACTPGLPCRATLGRRVGRARSRSEPCRWRQSAAAAGRPAGRRQDPHRRAAGHAAGDGRRPPDGDHRRRQARRRDRAARRLHQAARPQPDRRQPSGHARPRAGAAAARRAGADRHAGLRSVRCAQIGGADRARGDSPTRRWSLVLPAGLDAGRSRRPGAAPTPAAAPRLLVATRLDLARRLGGVLAAAAAGLALTEAGVGPGAADGLVPITPAWLAAAPAAHSLTAETAISHATDRAGRIVAVASGKGGVGKTWFAITLAHALARAGQARAAVRRRSRAGQRRHPARPDARARSRQRHRRSGARWPTRCCTMPTAASTSWPAAPAPARCPRSIPAVLERVLAALRRGPARYDRDAARSRRRPRPRGAPHVGLGRHAAGGRDRRADQPDRRLRGAEAARDADAAAGRCAHRGQPGGHAAGRANGPSPRWSAPARRSSAARPPSPASIRRDDRVRDAIRRQTLLLTRHPTSPAGRRRGGDRPHLSPRNTLSRAAARAPTCRRRGDGWHGS